MALILRLSFAAQVIAAFVIFVVGYIGLFTTLMLGLVIARCLYEAVKWLVGRAVARRRIASHFPLSTGHETERRIPLSSTQLVHAPLRAEAAFHPALDRRRVTGIVR
jgi:hypothetical protein